MFSSRRVQQGGGLRQHAGVLFVAVLASFALRPASAEEGPSDVGVSMAATLIGAISFMMLLYYFLNWPDKDVKQKSWETVSGTISIFCAVLLFQAVNDMVEAYIITPIFGEHDYSRGALMVDVIHMLMWFTIMQVSLACLSGAAGPFQVSEERQNEMTEEELEETLEAKEVNMKCFAVLLAHITGFASINAFGTVQGYFFSSSVLQSTLAVPVAFVSMIILQRITDTIRERISLGDDGEKDRFETLWDEETEEAENDVMGLAISFTIVNAVRYSISHCLPNQEGKEEGCKVNGQEDEHFLFHHTYSQKCMLIGAVGVVTFVIYLIRKNWPEWAEGEEEGGEEEEEEGENVEKEEKAPETEAEKLKQSRLELLARLLDGGYVSISMCFSWCFFYGLQMVIAGFHQLEGQDEVMSVILALLVSFVCMFGLIPLDKLADSDCTDDKCDRAIRSVIDAMALTIGFAWEQCFDTSVDNIAAKTQDSGYRWLNPHTTKLGLSIFCAGLLVPAWLWYILPFMVAKGWELYPLKLANGNVIQVHAENKDEAEHEFKLEKAIKALKTKHSSVKERSNERQEPELGGYEVLAGAPDDDIEALRQKNEALMSELEKARTETTKTKAASLKAQGMLENTLASMLASMKHMSQTVERSVKSA